MSQFNLTPEEDVMVLNALRTQANHYNAMFGSTDVALSELIAKVEGQLPQPEPVEVAIAEAEAEAMEAHVEEPAADEEPAAE